ncbi:hypothetical protein GP2_055_00150 [Gordonia paraffinivorans NBRC 108238]|uniref:AAA+ ATPase domain-containing protein n=1 Tax=Gordonia paraffinivorans NBRC 108238 TaxID=1223543 RepID=A0ABQ0IRE3_9ACTN|nr:protein DpdH [Gordonia paraffinivorans]GAC86132.1 hypothetical protein GP2_055_00150 [Gordonia paraffinivorans NBRC 108238]
MAIQTKFACWTPHAVTATIPTEAATPSDRVLLATHSPLRIVRRRMASGADSGFDQSITEQEVLDEFLESPTANGVLVASVIGESGTGKSHLVRWIGANIARTPTRHVIYLQKTETSLKDVIEKLLVDQHGPEFDELRNRLSYLGSGISLSEMEQRLLGELAEALRTLEPDTPASKVLVGDNGLRLFFLDPLFRDHLLREGSFIKRRARFSLFGRDQNEPEVPLQFTAAELPVDIGDYQDINRAAEATQKVFRRVASNPSLQSEAVRLLNKVLDTAVTKAANLNVGDVSSAFKKLRENLVGHEIILLIEDIALIQGVRRDLLDAIVEVGVIQGEERLASVRTMLAVTTGYYQALPDTFRTRAEGSSPTYVVDMQLKGDGSDDQMLVDFVGRYLNAARVGREELEGSSLPVRNACLSCEYRADCHATFGVSGQEYGLYPYNRAALNRAINACGDLVNHDLIFNPRRVLSRVVRDGLNDAHARLLEGDYPPPAFLREESAKNGLPALPIYIKEKIEKEYGSEQSGRVETLLTFWGNVGRSAVDGNILKAFGQPDISGSILVDTGEDEPSNEVEVVGPSDIPASVQRNLDDIDSWVSGKPLVQSLAQDLRSIVRDALLLRLEWFDPIIKEPDAQTINAAIRKGAHSVSIEGANENLPKASPIVRFSRDARTGVMFRGLVLIKAGYWHRSGDALSRLDAELTRCVPEAKSRILAYLEFDEPSLVQASASLIRGAVACGLLPDKPSDLELMNASLANASVDRPDRSSRADAWLRAYDAYVDERRKAIDRLLRAVGPAQGSSGSVHAVDVDRFLRIVRKACKIAFSDETLSVPSWCSHADRKLGNLIQFAGVQLDHWRALVERIRSQLPAQDSIRESVNALNDVVRIGKDLGYVRAQSIPLVVEKNEVAGNFEDKTIREVEKILEISENSEKWVRIGNVGKIWGVQLKDIADYLDFSSQWVDAGLGYAEVESAADDSTVHDRLKDVIRVWEVLVKEAEANER